MSALLTWFSVTSAPLSFNAPALQAGHLDARQRVAVDIGEVEVAGSEGVGDLLVGGDGVVGRGRQVVDRVYRDSRYSR